MPFRRSPAPAARAELSRDDLAVLVCITMGRPLPRWSGEAHLDRLRRLGLVRTTVLEENGHRVHTLTEDGASAVTVRLAQRDDVPPARSI